MTGDERRAFRRFVLDHHPDRGGDPETFLAGLARFRDERSPGPEAPANVVFYRRRRGLRRLTGWSIRHRDRRRRPPRVI